MYPVLLDLSSRIFLSNLSVIWRKNVNLMNTEMYHCPCLWLRTAMWRLMGEKCSLKTLFIIKLDIRWVEWLHARPLYIRRDTKCSQKPGCIRWQREKHQLLQEIKPSPTLRLLSTLNHLCFLLKYINKVVNKLQVPLSCIMNFVVSQNSCLLLSGRFLFQWSAVLKLSTTVCFHIFQIYYSLTAL